MKRVLTRDDLGLDDKPAMAVAQAQSSKLIQFEPIVDMVIKSVESENTRRVYRIALNEFMGWFAENGKSGFNRMTVHDYRAHLQGIGKKAATINLHLSAIRKLASESADNSMIDRNTALAIIGIENIKAPGNRTGNWLTKREAEAIINAPDTATLKGKRDRAILATLIGCGLRRNELTNLTVEHIQQREARWAIVDMLGKRNKIRTIPIAAWVKAIIDEWTTSAGITSGRVFCQVTRGKQGKLGAIEGKTGAGSGRSKDRSLGDGTTPQAIMRVVKLYGIAINKPELAPHDLRRTFAKLARKGRADLEQIQSSLGHASLDTTKKYLGMEIDYTNSPSDAIKLDL